MSAPVFILVCRPVLVLVLGRPLGLLPDISLSLVPAAIPFWAFSVCGSQSKRHTLVVLMSRGFVYIYIYTYTYVHGHKLAYKRHI